MPPCNAFFRLFGESADKCRQSQPFLRYIHSMKVPPVVLSIAGFDPSSGAGITADVKTAAAHGCYAVTCPTALTVQSSQGVFEVRPVDPDLVRRTLGALAEDLDIAAVRVGMLGSAAIATTVASTLMELELRNIVVDPVLRSSSGAALLDEQACRCSGGSSCRSPTLSPRTWTRRPFWPESRLAPIRASWEDGFAVAADDRCQAPGPGQPGSGYYRRALAGSQ